jgi:tetratricopeptide (TPR) repeat protein
VSRKPFVVALIAGLALSCKQHENAPPPAPTPPSMQEAEKFAKEFAGHMVPCSASALDRDVDLDLLITKAIAGRPISSAEASGLRAGLGSFGKMLCAQLGPGTTYQYLRSQMIDGTPHPLFRLLGTDGVNYHRLELDKQHEVRAADIYIFMTGEQLSETFGRLFEIGLQSGAGYEMSNKMGRIRSLMASKQLTEAYELLKSLPPKIRNTKPMLLIAVQLTSGLNTPGEPEYMAAIDAYAKAFPNDPSLDLVQVDGAFLRKKYDDAIAMIDRLDKQIGGDPYLETMRATAYGESGKHAEAIAHAKQATEREPTLEQGWWSLATQQTSGGDFTGALATLEVLRTKFSAHTDDADLRADGRFTALVASKEYAAWLKKQR